MKSHPVSYNCPFTLLFLLPSEPIWLIGQKWGHLCTKSLEPGDYLLTLEFSSHLKHLLLALTHAGGCWICCRWPLIHLFAACSASVIAGVCEGHGLSPHTPPGLSGSQRDRAERPAPTAAPEWHLVLGCRTARRRHPGCCPSTPSAAALLRISHGSVHLLPKNQGQGLDLGQQAKYLGYLKEMSCIFLLNCRIDSPGSDQQHSKIKKRVNLSFWLTRLYCMKKIISMQPKLEDGKFCLTTLTLR